MLIVALGVAGGLSAKNHPLLDEIAAADKAADEAVLKIDSPDNLRKQQKEWKAAWIEMLGGIPERTPLNAQVTGKIACKDYVAEKIIFESQRGVYVTGLLYLPNNPEYKAPYPALLIVHGHSNEGKLRDGYRRMAELAVKAGFGVFAPDPISQGERVQRLTGSIRGNCSEEHASLGARSWLVGWNFARFRIWDAVRSIDYMETRRDLDCSKLAIAGNSGGGTMSAYMQAFDERIKVACPNSFISSIRETVYERGVHDAEQFFHGQLMNGFNHAALLAAGQPRVSLMIGARHADYFPVAGVRSTYAVMKKFQANAGITTDFGLYSCDGPHGWAESSRQAALAWIKYHVKGEETPYCLKKDGTCFIDVEALRKVKGDFPFAADELQFEKSDGLATKTGQVRDIPGFRSLYALIAEEGARFADVREKNRKCGREKLREIVRRRANIRPLDKLPADNPPLFKHKYNWWYLKGFEGFAAEQNAACLALLGRSQVGERAECILRDALKRYKDNGNKPVPLKAEGTMCIAAAHAYAAEPQLFSSVEFDRKPESWMEMLKNPNPDNDSFAVAVWGALREYDWVDLIPAGR